MIYKTSMIKITTAHKDKIKKHKEKDFQYSEIQW